MHIESPRRPSFWGRTVTAVLLFAFFQVGYVWASHHPPGTGIDARTFLDGGIPLVPFFIVFYMLGFLFAFLPCFVLRERVELFWASVVTFGILCVSFLSFRTLPVVMYKTAPEGTDVFSQMTAATQLSDTCYNNFPSLHVSLSWLAFWILARRRGALIWFALPVPLLITASTLLVKQHLVIDVLGGWVLGLVAFALFRWCCRHHGRHAHAAYGVVMLLVVVVLIGSRDQLVEAANLALGVVVRGLPVLPHVLLLVGALLVSRWFWDRRRATRVRIGADAP